MSNVLHLCGPGIVINMLSRKNTLVILASIFILVASVNNVWADDCSCGVDDYYSSSPIEYGFLTLRGDELPDDVKKIDLCFWKKKEENDVPEQIDKYVRKGTLFKDGYKFDVDVDEEIQQSEFLIVRPRIKNRKIIDSVLRKNSCIVNEIKCNINRLYDLNKTWDVKVKTIPQNVELSVVLKKDWRAKQITPYGECPLDFDDAGPYASKVPNASMLPKDYTFQVQKDVSLSLYIKKGGEEGSGRTLPIKIKENGKEFGDDNKIRVYIKEVLKKFEKRGPSTRWANNDSLEYWGKSEEKEDDPEPDIVVERLVWGE